jgi:glycosyltransferase involved in cell wall biosynthesis
MRVIHIVHGKANPSSHNGISRVVYYLNKWEKILGINSEIWAIIDNIRSFSIYERDKYVAVNCFPRVKIFKFSNEIINRLVLEKDSIDLIHFHLIWFYEKNIIASALKKLGIKFIITTHGTYTTRHAYTGKRLIAKWLYEKRYLNLATEIHALSREEGAGLQKYGYKGRIFIVPNGIDIDELPAQRSSNYFDDKPYAKRLKFIWIGVLRQDKNLASLIEAVSILPEKIKHELIFILIGPDYKDNAVKIRKLTEDLNCGDCFDHIGPLYDQKKYDALQSADVFILPSFSEGISLAMLDAMACGKPCVLTSGCGMNYYMNGDFGIRCEPYAQDISRGIIEIYNQKSNWNQMTLSAQAAVANIFNWKQIASTMIENYSRIIKGVT